MFFDVLLQSKINVIKDNSWFEDSTSETVCTELLKNKMPSLYDKVYQLAHQQFCHTYANSEPVDGYDVYEIFIPDEIVCFARVKNNILNEERDTEPLRAESRAAAEYQ